MGDSNGRLCVGVMGTASKGSQAARGLNTWEAKKLSESDSKWLYQILKGLGRWDRKKEPGGIALSPRMQRREGRCAVEMYEV